ncbi:MAG: hypothetical protein Q7S12_00175 [bacterium]|nr:hypothetical protein [bacterium]
MEEIKIDKITTDSKNNMKEEIAKLIKLVRWILIGIIIIGFIWLLVSPNSPY